MAILKPGALVADIRGKVGDNVFTRSQGGPAVRSVGSWTQPDTDAQVATREALAALATAWSAGLDQAERDSWRTYAQQHPRPNRWGTPTQTSGYLAFIRHNFYAFLQDPIVAFLTAPTAPPIYPPTLAISIGRTSGTCTIELPPANYDPAPPGLTLHVFSGIPLTAGRNYYSGPWRWLCTIEPPDSAGPDPYILPWTWPIHATEPQYTWPEDGTGQTRAYAVAQDVTTGAISTRRILTPTMVTE